MKTIKNKNITNLKFKKKINKIDKLKDCIVSTNIDENFNIMSQIYNQSINTDIIFRKFNFEFNDQIYRCFLVMIDGLSARDSINDFVLKPLMQNKEKNINIPVDTFVENFLIYQNSVKRQTNIQKIIESINMGDTAIFIDTLDIAFVCDAKQYEHRTVSSPLNETVIKGPQEAFVESIRANTSLLRKLLNDEALVFESISIGEKSKTTCMIGYISDIANPKLIKKVKERLNNVSIDYLFDSGQLEQLIEDHPFMSFTQIISTERPEKVASHLAEGRICIIVNNSPYVLVVPCTFWDLFHSPEDYNMKFQFSNFIRLIRIIAYAFSLFLPAVYIAITSYHVDLLPTDLLFSIAAVKETIPFPLIIEVLIMELSFELIREASARMPGSVGSSIGILGAVLLGQASVDANLVSPILIFIVAITGICSFATPNYSLALGFRFIRFMYIILASFMGFLGILFGLILHLIYICSLSTFDIPYMILFSNYQAKPFRDGIAISPIWLDSFRPPFLKPLDKRKSSDISRKWVKRKDVN